MTAPSTWHRFPFRLVMRLGEHALGSVALPLLRRVYSLDEIRASAAAPVLPALDAGADGYLLANIPAASAGTLDGTGDWLHYCLKSYQRSYIDMGMDFEAYKGKFSSKTRSGIQRKIRKFAEASGGIDLRGYASAEEIATFLDLARPLSAATYQARLLDCGLPGDDGFTARALAAAARGEVRAFLLFAGARPVSYLYCPVAAGTLEYAYLGYAPDHAHLSPGTVLQWLAMERLFAEQRFSAFDFTEGDSEHKRLFGTHQAPCLQLLLLRPTLRNRLLLATHSGLESLSRGVVAMLDRLGLKQRIKRWLRRSA